MSLKSEKNNGYFTRSPTKSYESASLTILKMRNISEKVVEKITHKKNTFYIQ